MEPLKSIYWEGGRGLAVATGLQRGLGFLAATAAARIGGPAVFGAYAMALSTAGTAAGYMSLGLGTTASRFIGAFAPGTPAYIQTVRRILGASLMLACGTSLAILAMASPLAVGVLRNPALAPLLRFAALSAAAFVLYETLIGLALGLLKARLLILLSGLSGALLLVGLGVAARLGAEMMILAHSMALAAAVGVTLVTQRRTLFPPSRPADGSAEVSWRRLGAFGLTQLAAGAGISLASWAVALLLVRQTDGLVQMGYYGVANQLRGLTAMLPGFVAPLTLPLLARFAAAPGRQDDVLRSSTLICVASAVIVGGLILIGLPWILAVFGPQYAGAAAPVAVLVCTAVIHLGGTPTGNALLAFRLRAAALINACWTGLLLVLAVLWVPRFGALGAAAAFLAAHVAAEILVLAALKTLGRPTAAVAQLWGLGTAGILAIGGLALVRYRAPAWAPLAMAAQAVVLPALGTLFFGEAIRMGYLTRKGDPHGSH